MLIAAHRATYLDAALRSALGQTYETIEVILVDDSGGHEVSRVIEQYSDPRLRYVRNRDTLGPAGSHLRALTEAAGPVAGIINDDDLWEPELVDRLLSALEESPEAVVAFSDHWVLLGDRRDVAASDACSRAWRRDKLRPGTHRPFHRLALLDKTIPLAIAALFRTAIVADVPIPSEVGGAYDYFLSYVLARDGSGAVYVPERLASWRVHAGNLTGEASCRRAEEGSTVARIVMADERLISLRPELRRAYAEALWTVATRNLRAGSRVRAFFAALTAVFYGRWEASLLLPAVVVPRRLLRLSGSHRPSVD